MNHRALCLGILTLAACAGPQDQNTEWVGTTGGGTYVSTSPTSLTELAQAELVEHGVQFCADSTRGSQKFEVDVGAPLVGPVVYRGHGAGSAVGDFNGDGLHDALVIGHTVTELYQQETPGEFRLVPNAMWQDVDQDLGRGFGVAAADFDAVSYTHLTLPTILRV